MNREIESRWNKLRKCSTRALNVSSREVLARYLDIERPGTNRAALDYRSQDWKGLAEGMGFTYDEIQTMGLRPSKTKALLERWERTSNRSIGELKEHLLEIQRFDILEDEMFLTRVEGDVRRFNFHRTQVPEVDSSTGDYDLRSDDSLLSEVDSCLTRADVSGEGNVQIYDAFVCYADEDKEFVESMVEKLEDEHGFKLFLPERDTLPGIPEYGSWAEIISTRCKKVILIISEAFCNSAECKYLTLYSHSLKPDASTKKMIPVVLDQQCEKPKILDFIVKLHFTKGDWFWNRLTSALKAPSHGTLSAPNQRSGHVS